MGEWMTKIWYLYAMVYYTDIKRTNCHLQWRGLEIVILNEVSHTEKENIWYRLYVDSKKKKKMAQINQSIYKTEVEPQMQKLNLKLPVGKASRDKLEDWDWHIHITIYKIDNN